MTDFKMHEFEERAAKGVTPEAERHLVLKQREAR